MNRLSTVIEVASSNPITLSFFSILYFHQFVFFLFIDIIHNHFQSIWVAFHLLFVFCRFCIWFVIVVFPEYHLKDSKQ